MTDRIREFVLEEYVRPARATNRTDVTVRVRDVWDRLKQERPMRGMSSVICQALRSRKLLADSRMTIESIEGPPSKTSPTVVVHYKLEGSTGPDAEGPVLAAPESEEAWALRVTEKIRGLLKEEYASFGGGETFLEWVRSEEPEEVVAEAAR